MDRLKIIMLDLKYQLAVMKQRGEVMDKTSWTLKMGTILSGEDAEILVKYLQFKINQQK